MTYVVVVKCRLMKNTGLSIATVRRISKNALF